MLHTICLAFFPLQNTNDILNNISAFLSILCKSMGTNILKIQKRYKGSMKLIHMALVAFESDIII